MFMGNCHLYEDNIKDIKQLLERKPFEFPVLEIKRKMNYIDGYNVDDFIVKNYNHHEIIKMKMIV
jgi:thymidylate synthase